MSTELDEILKGFPQTPPFLFVDELLEASETCAVSRYTFHPDDFFYRGHFPGRPITPGVLLLEMAGQTAQALGICWMRARQIAVEDHFSLMTRAEIELLHPVLPGQRVTCESRRDYLRMKQFKMRSVLRFDDGTPAAEALNCGLWVPRASATGLDRK